MDSVRRVSLFVLATAMLPHCTPDFDALSDGGASNGGMTSAGNSNGGTESSGGSPGAGSAHGGASPGGTAVGGDAMSVIGGASGAADRGDAGAENELGGASGAGGTASPCSTWPDDGVTVYNGFDEGLEGAGFSSVSARGSVDTTKGATASYAWDAAQGSSCPGALRFSFSFKAYASGSEADEVGFGTYEFAPTSWVSGSALHLKVKVSLANAPISGVRLFVISGDKYLYSSVFDDTAFKTGEWNEMVMPTVAGDYYDPNSVRQLGIEVRLARAGTPDIPAQPPQPLQVWLDDIWLQPN